MLRESCEVPTCDDPQREKAEDGCKGGIGWHMVAGSGGLCALWQAGVCHAGHREGSTAGLARAPRRRWCDFSVCIIRLVITTPRLL